MTIVSSMKNIILLGCGGHARSIADLALHIGFQKILFVDKNAKPGEAILDFPVLPNVPAKLSGNWLYFAGSGNNKIRYEQLSLIKSKRLPLAKLISPLSILGKNTTVEEGCFVGNHVYVGPNSKIGLGSILNNHSLIEHDCDIGSFTHVSVNSTVAGNCKVGNFVMMGASSTLIDNINIGNNIVIGAGAVVVRDCNIVGTYVGVPAKLIN